MPYACTLQDDDIGHIARSLVAWILTGAGAILLPPHLWCFHDGLPYYALLNYKQILTGNHTSSPSNHLLSTFFLVYSSIARTFLCVNSYDVAVAAMLNDPQQRRRCVLKIWNLAEIPLGIEHDQCPLKRFFGTVLFCDIWSVCRNPMQKHVQVKVFQLQCLIPS